FSRDRMHIGGLALDRYLPGARQRRPSPLARLGERASILRHLLVGELTQDGVRQDLFNEIIVLQDHRLAGFGTQRLQGWTHSHLVPVVPACGATIASMNAIPLTALRWRLAQSKPRAEPQSWMTKVTRSRTSRASSRASR